MARYQSYEDRLKLRTEALKRLPVIRETLKKKLAEAGITDTSHWNWNIWGNRVVELEIRRVGRYYPRKTLREKGADFKFDYAAAVELIRVRVEHIQQQKALLVQELQEEAEFKQGLAAVVEAWPQEVKTILQASSDFQYRLIRDSCIEISLRFTQADAAKLQAVVEALAPVLGFEDPYLPKN